MPKRKKLFVDGAVQGSLLRRVAFHWSLYFTGLVVVLGIFYVLQGFATSKPISLNGFFQEHLILFAVLLSLIPVFLYDTLKLSHRFAGPIVRLRGGLRDWADGKDVQPISLRKHDFWSELADEFNRAIERHERELEEVAQRTAHATSDEPVEVGL